MSPPPFCPSFSPSLSFFFILFFPLLNFLRSSRLSKTRPHNSRLELSLPQMSCHQKMCHVSCKKCKLSLLLDFIKLHKASHKNKSIYKQIIAREFSARITPLTCFNGHSNKHRIIITHVKMVPLFWDLRLISSDSLEAPRLKFHINPTIFTQVTDVWSYRECPFKHSRGVRWYWSDQMEYPFFLSFKNSNPHSWFYSTDTVMTISFVVPSSPPPLSWLCSPLPGRTAIIIPP